MTDTKQSRLEAAQQEMTAALDSLKNRCHNLSVAADQMPEINPGLSVMIVSVQEASMRYKKATRALDAIKASTARRRDAKVANLEAQLKAAKEGQL